MQKKATAPANVTRRKRDSRAGKAKAQAPAPAEAVAAAFAPEEEEATQEPTNPLDLLLPYQKRLVFDKSRFVAACFARQTGKSFSVACRVAGRMIAIPGLTVVIAAPSGRQSNESLDKVKDWLRAFSVAWADEVEDLRDIEADLFAKSIKMKNGSRCIAVPGKPSTVRGFSGDIWLDEFAFFEQPQETWKAILPTITNSMRGGKKTVMITSTPNGRGVRGIRFYKIMMGETKGAWSRHLVPLKSAIAEGLPTDYQELADLMDDAVAQAQELDCEFLDDTSELLSYELIAGATSPDATSVAAPEVYAPGSGRDIRLGIDFGRTNDPTVCWMFERVGDVCYTREVLVLKNCPTPAQEEILRSRIRVARRVCFDYTGPGIGMGDHLVQEFGQWNPGKHEFGKIELCTFTVAFKRDIFPKLRRAFEAPVRVRIPAGEDIREDLHSMQQLIKNGEYTYSAPHTSEGHSDRCTALALAWRAAADAVCTDMPIPVDRASAWEMPQPVSREIMNRPF